MKFREKYALDHPGEPDPKGCPEDHNYEPDDYACDEMPNCRACWEREMPEGGNK